MVLQIIDMCCDGIDALITEKDFDDCAFVDNMKDGKLPPVNYFRIISVSDKFLSQ